MATLKFLALMYLKNVAHSAQHTTAYIMCSES